MRYVSASTVSLGRVFWAALLACCLQISVAVVADDSAAAKPGDEALQAEGLKRQWDRIHGGWDLKNGLPLSDQAYSASDREKRAWQNLQGVWGKRFAPSEDDLAIQELASILEQESREAAPVEVDNDLDIHEDKRSWDKFNDGWGKRNKWEKFRGSWGKREPAWSNLKGIWGKRSLYQYAN